MPDNTNVNNNASVVVVGRTAPVPPGQQKSDKSVPVVIASDQSTIPVAEQNKVQSEVALSLLGIPRSEVALGIFADVNTYDVNPTEWAADPEIFTTVSSTTGYYGDVPADMGHGLTHIPAEAGALLEAPVDKTAVLTSKRFFRYQPGRVSAATFGVKTSVMNPSTTDTSSGIINQDIGITVFNPPIRKYGIFDNESKLGIKKELGDVLWYISNLCTELNFNLEDVALQNLEKLKLRAAKGKISGSGDDR